MTDAVVDELDKPYCIQCVVDIPTEGLLLLLAALHKSTKVQSRDLADGFLVRRHNNKIRNICYEY